jgi:hypothetical protein
MRVCMVLSLLSLVCEWERDDDQTLSKNKANELNLYWLFT